MLNSYFFLSKNQNVPTLNLSCDNSAQQTNLFHNGNEHFYQNFVFSLHSQHQIFQEIEAIKAQLKQVKEQNTMYFENIQRLEKEKKELECNEKRGKKTFRKNIYCPYETCMSKYSSKIALNSHVRMKHKRKDANRVEVQSTDCQF